MNAVIPPGASFQVRVVFVPTAQGLIEQTLPITLVGGEVYLLTFKGRGTAPIGANETWDSPVVSDVASVRAAADPKFKAFTFNFGQVPVGQKMPAVVTIWNRTASDAAVGEIALPFKASHYAPDAPKVQAGKCVMTPAAPSAPAAQVLADQVIRLTNAVIDSVRHHAASLRSAANQVDRTELDAALGTDNAKKLADALAALDACVAALV